jgi:hypothetical protein
MFSYDRSGQIDEIEEGIEFPNGLNTSRGLTLSSEGKTRIKKRIILTGKFKE